MALALRILVLATAFSHSVALVNFEKSTLYDEYDFATQALNIANVCDLGCRIYVSVPESSANIAKQIIVHDYNHPDKSLYDISQMTKGLEKGYFEVEYGNEQVTIFNRNPGLETAPIAVWIVSQHANDIHDALIYDATSLHTVLDWSSMIGTVTIMSAEPFTVNTTTKGPMKVVATLTGFDSVGVGSGEACISVFGEMNETLYSDVQVAVHSPMISFFFDVQDYANSNVFIEADVGNYLDFSGHSFVASPGYIGCKANQMFRSSLYEAITSYKFFSTNRLYDVELISRRLNTDAAHPVTITDSKNNKKITWSGTRPGNTQLLVGTNNLEFSWSKNDQNLDQLVFIQVTPSLAAVVPSTSAPITEEPVPCLGFGEGTCYMIGQIAESFDEAVKICERLSATVASVHSAKEDSFIRRLATSHGQVNGLYLGATGEGKVFEWIDGTEWDYQNFYPEFPLSGAGECLFMDTSSSTGEWINVACSSSLPVACERK